MLRPSIAVALTASALPLAAEEFRWSTQTDPQTMDPHAVNSSPVLGFLNNVYEGLVRRGRDMAIEPSLAERWEPLPGGAGWRFYLRQDVQFHDGATFDADDVLFSYERASSEAADTASWFAPVTAVEVVDAHTVDILTAAPNPIFPDSIANWMIMDRDWAEANGATLPAAEAGNHATLNANGTGAFRLVRREPGLATVLEPFEGWWGEVTHNLTRAELVPIQNPATAVSALLSGEVDLINPVPVQDAARLSEDPNTQVIQGIEARVIMLGFAHAAASLRADDTGAANPFAEAEVREAVAHAINVPAILQTIMRGSAAPASQLVSPDMRGYTGALSAPFAFDPDRARAQLAEAGYPDGFAFEFKCTNDRYLNDAAVCQAVAAMLTQVGLSPELETMPVRNYWPELREGNFDLYLLGWSPGTFDAEHPLRFLVHTPGDRLGTWNFGGYSNARIDELIPQIQSTLDEGDRQAMLDEAAALVRDDVVYVPLYVQPLIWGARNGVELVQRPDNFLILRWVQMN